MIASTPVLNVQLAQDLDAVTELVERGPCVRAAARDRRGNPCPVSHDDAYYFCPMGAAMVITRGEPDGDMRYLDLMDALQHELGEHMSLPSWADRHKPADIVGLCQRAARRARGLA